MAIYHLTVKNGTKGNGFSHAEYICRQGKYSDRVDELIYEDCGNLPKFCKEDPMAFWEAGDEFERANGRVYTEIEFSLPNELNMIAQVKIVEEFIKENLEGQPYHYAIHENIGALSGEKNPHVHIMFSERQLDNIERPREQFFKQAYTKKPEIGGNKKNRKLNKKNFVNICRKSCEEIINKHLERAGFEREKVDCRSLVEQRNEALLKGDFEKAEELNRPPQEHLGRKKVYELKNKAKEKKVVYEEIKKINEEIKELKKELKKGKFEEAKLENPEQPVLNKADIESQFLNRTKEDLILERNDVFKNVITIKKAYLIAQKIHKTNCQKKGLPYKDDPEKIKKIAEGVLKKNKPIREQYQALNKAIKILDKDINKNLSIKNKHRKATKQELHKQKIDILNVKFKNVDKMILEIKEKISKGEKYYTSFKIDRAILIYKNRIENFKREISPEQIAKDADSRADKICNRLGIENFSNREKIFFKILEKIEKENVPLQNFVPELEKKLELLKKIKVPKMSKQERVQDLNNRIKSINATMDYCQKILSVSNIDGEKFIKKIDKNIEQYIKQIENFERQLSPEQITKEAEIRADKIYEKLCRQGKKPKYKRDFMLKTIHKIKAKIIDSEVKENIKKSIKAMKNKVLIVRQLQQKIAEKTKDINLNIKSNKTNIGGGLMAKIKDDLQKNDQEWER